jgi:hypothetical protein
MSRWFRVYDELLDDPKVQKLPAEDFKGWVNLLCLASRNNGKLPPIADIAFALRETQDAVSTLLERLFSGGLIERRSGGHDGGHYAPYRWSERQYTSDTSTARVKRFRERSTKQDETVPETPPVTETEQSIPLDKSNGAQPNSDAEFWQNAKAYLGPKRASLIGQWVRDFGKEATAAAITAAQLDRAVNPVEFIQGRFRKVRAQPTVPL